LSKRAAIYARKSRISEKGDSIENQIDKCKNYLSNIEVTEYEVFKDDGFSGKNTDRPAFTKLISMIKEKKFDILICYKLDRISRNVSDFSSLVKELEELNISFISVIENFDTGTAMGKAMLYITSVFSQLERETISQRICDNMYALAQKGYWLGGRPPTGFKNKRITYIDQSNKHRSLSVLHPIDNEIALIQLLFDKYLELKSLSKLNKYLLQNMIKTPTGKDFTKSTLGNILRNVAYVKCDNEVLKYLHSQGFNTYGTPNNINGMLIYKRHKGKNSGYHDKNQWIYAISSHAGIITSEKWLAVQNLLNNNYNKAPRTNSSTKALLTPLLRCSECNSKMRLVSGTPAGPNKIRPLYYKCCLKANSGNSRCNSKNIRVDILDTVIVEKIKTILLDKNELLSELILAKNNLESSPKIGSQKSLLKKRSKINSMIDNLMNNIASTTNTDLVQIYNDKIVSLKVDLVKVEKELIEIDEQLSYQEEIINNTESFIQSLKNISDTIDTASIEDKKNFINSIIQTIIVNSNTGKVIVKFKALT